MNITRIYDGIATRETTFQILNKGQQRMQTYDGTWYDNPHYGPVEAGQWFEIEGEEYQHFLNVMPPAFFDGHAFAMSEFYTHDLTRAFFNIEDRYFCINVEFPPGSRPREIMNQTGHALREVIQ